MFGGEFNPLDVLAHAASLKSVGTSGANAESQSTTEVESNENGVSDEVTDEEGPSNNPDTNNGNASKSDEKCIGQIESISSIKNQDIEKTVERVVSVKVNPDHSYASGKNNSKTTSNKATVRVIKYSAMPPEVQQTLKRSLRSGGRLEITSAGHIVSKKVTPTTSIVKVHQKTVVGTKSSLNDSLKPVGALSSECQEVDSESEKDVLPDKCDVSAPTSDCDTILPESNIVESSHVENDIKNEKSIDLTSTEVLNSNTVKEDSEGDINEMETVTNSNKQKCTSSAECHDSDSVVCEIVTHVDSSARPPQQIHHQNAISQHDTSTKTDIGGLNECVQKKTVVSDLCLKSISNSENSCVDNNMEVPIVGKTVDNVKPQTEIQPVKKEQHDTEQDDSFLINELKNKDVELVTHPASVTTKYDQSETGITKPTLNEPSGNQVNSNSNIKHKYIIEDDIPPTAKFNTSKKSDLTIPISKNTNIGSPKIVTSTPNKLGCNYHVLSMAGIPGTSSTSGIQKLLVPTSSLTNLYSRNKMKTLLLSSSQLKALNLSAAKMGPPLKLLPHKQQSSSYSGGNVVAMPALSVPITNLSNDQESLDNLPCDIRSPGADSGVSTASPASVSDREDLIDDIMVTPLEDDRSCTKLFERSEVFDSESAISVSEHRSSDSKTMLERAITPDESLSLDTTNKIDTNDGSVLQKDTIHNVSSPSCTNFQNNTILEGKDDSSQKVSADGIGVSSSVTTSEPSTNKADTSSNLCVTSIMKMVAEEERRLSEEKIEDIDVCSIDQEETENPKTCNTSHSSSYSVMTPSIDKPKILTTVSKVDELKEPLVKCLTKPLVFPDIESSSSSLHQSPSKTQPMFQTAEPVSVDDTSRDSLSSSISGRITPVPLDGLSSSYEISPGSKNLNIKLTEKVTPEGTVNQSKSRATIGSFGSLTAANFKVNSELPKELTSVADRHGVKMSTELYARLKSPGPITTVKSAAEGLPCKKLVKRSLLTNTCQTSDNVNENVSEVGMIKTVSTGKQRTKKTNYLSRSTIAGSQDHRIKPKLGRPRSKRTSTPTKVKKELVPNIDLSMILEPQSEIHPLVDHDYCHFVAFCGTVQRSIIAKSESRTERKYSKKTKAARTKGTKSNSVSDGTKDNIGTEDMGDVEKLLSRKRSTIASPSINSQTKIMKSRKKSPKEHISTNRLSSESGRTKTEGKRRYERRASADKRAKSAAAATSAVASTQGKSDKNFVKITGSYQDDFVYYATKRKSSSKRRQVKENPMPAVVPTQLAPVNVFDWYKEMSRADKNLRFGSEAHKPETSQKMDHPQDSAGPPQMASDFSSFIPASVETMMVDHVEKIDTTTLMSPNNMDTQPDLEALGLTPEQVRTILSAMDAAEMSTFKDLGQTDGKAVVDESSSNQTAMESSFDTENLQPSIDMSAYNDFMQASRGNTNPEYLDINVANQGAPCNKLFDLDDDFQDLLPSDMVNMNILLNDISPVKNSSANNRVNNANVAPTEYDHTNKEPAKLMTNVLTTPSPAMRLLDSKGNHVFGEMSSALHVDGKTMDKTALFTDDSSVNSAVSVSHNTSASEVTAPELTTVSMYWNDLPGLLIKNREYVRLVDIHKQVLPAKDTGILKKRCQMLGLEINTCSELQRDFLIRYANAAKSKSTVIVPKESAKNLIGFYVDPKPKVNKLASLEHAEPPAAGKKSTEKDLSILDTSSSAEESSVQVIKTVSSRRDSSDSQTRRKQIQLKLKDQTVMRVVTEMEVSDDEEEEEEMEEGEDLTQIESEDISAEPMASRHPHVRRLSKKSEDSQASEDDDGETTESVKEHSDSVMCLNDSGEGECVLDTDNNDLPIPIKKRTIKLKRLKDKNDDRNKTLADKLGEMTSSDENSGVDYSSISVAESKENLEDELRINAQKKLELTQFSDRKANNKKQLTKEERQNLNKLKRRLRRKELRLKEKLKKLKGKGKVPKKRNSLPNKGRQKKAQTNQSNKSRSQHVNPATKDSETKSLVVSETQRENNSNISNCKTNNTNDVLQDESSVSTSRVVQVLHRDSSHREGHRGRTQSGLFHLDKYQARNSACVQCQTCREFFSVSRFLKHQHRPNCPDEITEVLLPQQLDLRNSTSEQDDAVWEEFKKRRLSFEIGQSSSHAEKHRKEPASEKVQVSTHVEKHKKEPASVKIQSPSHGENHKVENISEASTSVEIHKKDPVSEKVKAFSEDVVEEQNKEVLTIPSDAVNKEPKENKHNNNSNDIIVIDNEDNENETYDLVSNPVDHELDTTPHVINGTVTSAAGTRHSSRVRKRKQLHPIESYVYSKALPTHEPEVRKPSDNDVATNKSEPENGKIQVAKSDVVKATPNSFSQKRKRSSPDVKRGTQTSKSTPKYDLRTTSSPEESPLNKRRRILTRKTY